jgi:Protein of unknown function (DUF2934)
MMPSPKEKLSAANHDLRKSPIEASHEDIARRAYYLYLGRGAADGDLSDWLQAESQLRDESSVPKLSVKAKSA